jgi:protein TonB
MFRFQTARERVLLIAVLLGSTTVPSAQTTPPPESRHWIAHGSLSYSQSSDGIEIRSGRGVLRTDRFYVDLTMRFQFQLLEPSTEALVFVRSLFPSPTRLPEVGYRIHLSESAHGDKAHGRVTGWSGKYAAAPVVEAALSGGGGWHECEIRIVGSTLSARVDSIETTRVADLSQFVGYVGFQVGAGRLRIKDVQIEALPTASDGFPEVAAKLGEGIRNPTVAKEVRPVYSMEAVRDRIQGVVKLEMVVREDGTVGDVRVISSLHHDLDASAVAAARQWRFRPATKDGREISVVVNLELSFKLK